MNLGAQPPFIPAEGGADLKKLKEYECVLRRRVGSEWPWQLSDETVAVLASEITATQAEFFGNEQTLRGALADEPPATLIRRFRSDTNEARAALHRLALRRGWRHVDTARKLVTRGLELAGDRATILREELRTVLDFSGEGAAQPDAERHNRQAATTNRETC